MRSYVRAGSREWRISSGPASWDGGAALELCDREQARELLRRMMLDPENGRVLRAALVEVEPGTTAVRVQDAAVADRLSEHLLAGRVRLVDPAEEAEVLSTQSVEVTEREELPPPPPPPPLRAKTWVKFKVVEDATARPVPGVRLRITTPDGVENFYTTNGAGMIEISDIDKGTCGIRGDIKDARLTDTLDFVRVGEAKAAGGGAAEGANGSAGGGVNGSSAGGAGGGGGIKRIAEIEPYKVTRKDSLDKLAKVNGMTWQELCRFNFGTDVPREINEKLRDQVGCTRKTKDGHNYMFDDSDNPGVVYIPGVWELGGLATATTHIIRVREFSPVPGFELIVPLELDPEDNPAADDRVRLRSLSGEYERIIAATDESCVGRDEERRLLLYNFGRVPEDTYGVWVLVGGQWYSVLRELKVTKDGCSVGGREVSVELDDLALGYPGPGDEAAEEPAWVEDGGLEVIDQDESLYAESGDREGA